MIMKKRSFCKMLSIIMVLLTMMCVNVPLVFASDSNTIIRIYYPNGDWQYVPVDLELPLNHNSYLSALNHLVTGKNMPQGCYNEFPKDVKVNNFEIKNNIAYIDIDKSLVDKIKSKNLSIDVVKDILSYNIFSFDKTIENIVFTFNGKTVYDFSTVNKQDFFGGEPSSEVQKEINKKVEVFKEKIKGMSPDQIKDFIKKEAQKQEANKSTFSDNVELVPILVEFQ